MTIIVTAVVAVLLAGTAAFGVVAAESKSEQPKRPLYTYGAR